MKQIAIPVFPEPVVSISPSLSAACPGIVKDSDNTIHGTNIECLPFEQQKVTVAYLMILSLFLQRQEG